jgi:16S rRNA U1498 N3-methylase RsmE
MGTFLKNNFKKVFLWNRILRTETAWIVTGFYITQSK